MDFIHIQPLLELKLLLLFLYIGMWYGINWIFNFINDNDHIRLDLVTAFFYCIWSPLLLVLLFYQVLMGVMEYWPIHIHLVIGGVAFYAFGLMEEFRLKDQYEWDVVIHHVVFGTFFFAFAVMMNFSWWWAWLPALQSSGAFYYLGRALKQHHPNLHSRLQNRLEILNFWVFLSSRVVFQTALMIFLGFEVLERMPPIYNYSIILALFLSFVLNINWFIQITKRYMATKARIQLANP